MCLCSHRLVELYEEISIVLFLQDRFDEVIQCGERGLAILGDDTECPQAAMMNSRIAVGHRQQGNYKKYVEYTTRNMVLVDSLPYSQKIHGIYDEIVEFVAVIKGDLGGATEWLRKWRERCQQHGNLVELAHVSWKQAEILKRKGDLSAAIEEYQKAQKMFERIGDIHHTSECFADIGIVLFELGDLWKAEERYQSALKLKEQVGNKRNIATLYVWMGEISLAEGNWEEAIQRYERTVQICEEVELETSWVMMLGQIGLGIAYHKRGKYDKAIASFEKTAYITLTHRWALSEALVGLEYILSQATIRSLWNSAVTSGRNTPKQ